MLRNLPEVYETTVELLMRDLEDNTLKWDDVMSILREKFKIILKGSDASDNALMGRDSKLECPHCGKSGHRADNCWSKPENKSSMEEWKRTNNYHGNNSGSSGKCHICGETGHRQYPFFKVKCYKCNKLGHMKSNCTENLDSAQFCREVAGDSDIDFDIFLMMSNGSVGKENYWI